MCGSTGRESCRSQFDSLPLHEWESSRKGGEYDIRSVMHYGKFYDIIFLVGISNWCWHSMALSGCQDGGFAPLRNRGALESPTARFERPIAPY